MADMTLNQVGTQVHGLIENIPTAISGTVMLNLVQMQMRFMETYTGYSIGSTAISDVYQSALINLSAAEVLTYMQMIGADVSSVSIGDFSVSKGQGSNLSNSADILRERGMEQLKASGWRGTHYQSL